MVCILICIISLVISLMKYLWNENGTIWIHVFEIEKNWDKLGPIFHDVSLSPTTIPIWLPISLVHILPISTASACNDLLIQTITQWLVWSTMWRSLSMYESPYTYGPQFTTLLNLHDRWTSTMGVNPLEIWILTKPITNQGQIILIL